MKRFVCKTAVAAAFMVLAAADAYAGGANTWGLGVEGFQDTYKESSLDVTDKTTYGSVTGYYSRNFGKSFIAVDARVSYGTDDYDSPSGHLSGVPQWETDLRARYGRTFQVWNGALSPYIGLGWRYFLDEGKGYTTDLGAQAYDRRISQFYIPIGATFGYGLGNGWSVTPQAEGDIMFYGDVNTRLTNLTGLQFNQDPDNIQHFGLGARSEIMFGKTMDNYTLQAGPFVRFWWVPQSDKVTYQNLSGGPDLTVWEPENTRLQVGGALRVLW